MNLDLLNRVDGTDKSSTLALCIGTWNLAGLSLDDCDLLIEQISGNYVWDFVLLQETFFMRRRRSIGKQACYLLS